MRSPTIISPDFLSFTNSTRSFFRSGGSIGSIFMTGATSPRFTALRPTASGAGEGPALEMLTRTKFFPSWTTIRFLPALPSAIRSWKKSTFQTENAIPSVNAQINPGPGEASSSILPFLLLTSGTSTPRSIWSHPRQKSSPTLKTSEPSSKIPSIPMSSPISA